MLLMFLLDFSYDIVPLIYSPMQVASMLPEEAFTVIRKSFDARKVLIDWYHLFLIYYLSSCIEIGWQLSCHKILAVGSADTMQSNWAKLG